MSVTESTVTIASKSEHHTQMVGRLVSHYCRVGDVIALHGDLGAGKTVFSRGFIREITASETDVPSPTFTLVQQYNTQEGITLWHFDLYRIEVAEEITETGLEEALERGITLIEWPDIAADHLPEALLHVDIAYGSSEAERMILLSAKGDRWVSCLNEIMAQYENAA